KERRVSSVQQAMDTLAGAQDTINHLRRDVDTLKSLGDFVGQKIAALEAQRDAIGSALARAEQLDRVQSQIDADMRQQQENQVALDALKDQLNSLKSLHSSVSDRSNEMLDLQRETEKQAQAIRAELAHARDEMKNAGERFEFETRGLESVSQRV